MIASDADDNRADVESRSGIDRGGATMEEEVMQAQMRSNSSCSRVADEAQTRSN